MISTWTRTRLEAVEEAERILVRDSLRLLPEADGVIHNFARDHGFTVIVCSTNLVFRELYERSLADPDTKKLLIIDRAPARRRAMASVTKAPPPFYPDILEDLPESARIDLDLRQFLKEQTGDPNWPMEVNDPQYARLIARNLPGVLRAHENLRNADAKRFNDHDFKTIVAYAALGVADSALKHLQPEDYWRIGLLAHEQLGRLEDLAPEVTRPIQDELRKAPAPFCWFAEHDAETVLRAFYLSVILSQHFEHWDLLLANIDSSLAALGGIKPDILKDAAPDLIALNPDQAQQDIASVEESLSKDSLRLLLLDKLDITSSEGFAGIVQRERYSTLLRSLAMLLALDDLLSSSPAAVHENIRKAISPDDGQAELAFVDKRPSVTWSHLKEAYWLAGDCRQLRKELGSAVKKIKVQKAESLSFKRFWNLWNEKQLNRIEYFVSALERLVFSGDFLPRPEDDLPSVFANALNRIRQNVSAMSEEVYSLLDELNLCFQEMVVRQYPSWVQKDDEAVLTSQFIRRCLKSHWDPATEKAVVFIFDGMRTDVWDEFLRPMVDDRMQLIKEYRGCSILPSETQVTRKAISAGTFPDEFDTGSAENGLLKKSLARELNYTGDVKVVPPDAMGTGETVRYRAGNLDVYIFELCDKELHKIQTKKLPDGRQVPGRPLAFIYQQHLKNIIDTEVMAIVRGLAPGTKVFITADHGFGRIHRQRLGIDATWLNESFDCSYLNAELMKSLDDLGAPRKVRENVWELPVSDLRMPATTEVKDRKTGRKWQKKFASVIFPKVGYALARPNSHFNPDAYSHGGISIQELMIPMAVLRVRDKDEGLLTLDELTGPAEAVEGQEAQFHMRLSRTPKAGLFEELRVDVEATYAHDPERESLREQVRYVGSQGAEVTYAFRPDPDDATDEERRSGTMARTLTITVSYKDGLRTVRKSRSFRFTVRLNSEQVIRRVPAHLGNILGLTPKSMR